MDSTPSTAVGVSGKGRRVEPEGWHSRKGVAPGCVRRGVVGVRRLDWGGDT